MTDKQDSTVKNIFVNNIGNLITIFILIAGLAIAWGIIRTEVSHNTDVIARNESHIDTIKVWQSQTDVKYAEIQKDLQYIKALLLNLQENK